MTLSSLNDLVRPQIEALHLERGRPLLVVDADEVLVYFLRDFKHFVRQHGWELRLTEYSLESALHHLERAEIGGRDVALNLIDLFFAQHTHKMEAISGAANALDTISVDAQVIVLSNLPDHAKAARIANLRGHGISYPVLSNTGGKGRVLRYLAAQVDAPVAFVDDSPSQVESARKHAPMVATYHFVGCDEARAVIPAPADTPYVAENWAALTPYLRDTLRG